MDILIVKDHMEGGAWVHAGTSKLDVDPVRAADLMRNGLARPLVSLKLHGEADAASAKSAAPNRNQAAAPKRNQAAAPKRNQAADSKPRVQTSAQDVQTPPPSLSAIQPEEPAGAAIVASPDQGAGDAAGLAPDGADNAAD
ncbi:hypothetical protein ASD15_21950 [Massilia sp. Root351]|jgi:hypothetical protein|uniref:hypothetical protein n=1 Tax=Massilia sp. Root351 TaxID=1736522 RepID=UPI00070D7D0D|nr:hypothetical protein [Massilia sp. Root351]KQV78479.1 hypothetical protein ASD15_21950 [Massilia sp. Root351]